MISGTLVCLGALAVCSVDVDRDPVRLLQLAGESDVVGVDMHEDDRFVRIIGGASHLIRNRSRLLIS
jgi:hypothetical protein